MQSKRGTQPKAQRRTITLDDERVVDLDRRLMEAMERIERVSSKARMAVGTMLATGR